MFYQYVPDSTVWKPNCVWGHATGPDLFSLEERPVAIPTGDGDDGVWTGCLVLDYTGAARVFYTAVSQPDLGIGRIRVAFPTDGTWDSWTKGDVVIDAPHGLEVVSFRDPFVHRADDAWHMVVGAGLADGTAAALDFRSDDLSAWAYRGIGAARNTAEREPVWTGSMWECPQLFELDGRHILLTSAWDDGELHSVTYGVGTYADDRFRADVWGQLSFGRSYYAPSVFRDREGRSCLVFWMRGVEDTAARWSGAHSVPYLLSLSSDTLVAVPHPDIARYVAQVPAPGGEFSGAADVRWSPQVGDQLVVRADDRELVRIETDESSLTVTAAAEPWSMPYSGGDVRLLLDGPIAEISTRDGVLGTPMHPTGSSTVVSASGVQATVWQLGREATAA